MDAVNIGGESIILILLSVIVMIKYYNLLQQAMPYIIALLTSIPQYFNVDSGLKLLYYIDCLSIKLPVTN